MELFLKLSDIGLSSILVFFDRVVNFFNTPIINLIAGSNFGGIFAFLQTNRLNTYASILEGAFGLNLRLPLWEFLLINIGIILSLTVLLRLVNLINPF